ncbi:hypothetical protein ACFOYW_12955 [Gryllotalpicola reticulitermitis]|uniref:Mannosyltransferase n=1 Tax=Gryllotalpicola reticulitermitis TaxID=1184153 RepID=A0ABV8QAD0_9MICO
MSARRMDAWRMPAWRMPARRMNARRWSALTVAGFGFVVSFALSWVPSLDFNEAATVVSARRPWSAFWTEIHHVDAVHATYYAFMHLWLGVFGYTPMALRTPASIAAGVAAGLVVMLGSRLSGLRVGVAAGVVFAVLPITMWEGYWGREYELTMALATGLVLLFLAARDRTLREERSWPWWLAFAVMAAASQYVFGYLIMVCIGLAGSVALPAIRRRPRALSAMVRLGLASAVAIAAWAPIALLEMREKGQVSWIPGLSANTITGVLEVQYFQGSVPLAIIGWTAAAVATIGGVWAWRRRASAAGDASATASPGASATGDASATGGASATASLVTICLPWLVVPTGILLVLTGFGAHVYVPRYVAFTAPAMALLIAAPAAWIRWRPGLCTASIVAVLLAIVAPTWAAQRTPGAREADTWNTIAATVAAARKAEPAGARDAVVFGAAHAHKVATSQVIADIYPAAFAGMTDVTLAVPYTKASGLWSVGRPFTRALPSACGADYIWVLATVESHQASAAIDVLSGSRYHVSREWLFHGEQLVQLAADTPRGIPRRRPRSRPAAGARQTARAARAARAAPTAPTARMTRITLAATPLAP